MSHDIHAETQFNFDTRQLSHATWDVSDGIQSRSLSIFKLKHDILFALCTLRPSCFTRTDSPCRTASAGLVRVCSSLANMGNRAFASRWLLAVTVLLLVGLQHAVITALPLRGPAGKTLKLTPGKVSSAISTPKLEFKPGQSKSSRVQAVRA